MPSQFVYSVNNFEFPCNPNGIKNSIYKEF